MIRQSFVMVNGKWENERQQIYNIETGRESKQIKCESNENQFCFFE